jgi:uncharacterized membrane protein
MVYFFSFFCSSISFHEVSFIKVEKVTNRLTYLDWMRGLGVLIMLQGHVLESWVRPKIEPVNGFGSASFWVGCPPLSSFFWLEFH